MYCATKLSFHTFDIHAVIANSACLMASDSLDDAFQSGEKV